jgi:hypothetical protein
MAPSLAWNGWRACVAPRSYVRLGLVLTASAIFMTTFAVGMFPEVVKLHALGAHPVATLLWTIFLLMQRPDGSAVNVQAPIVPMSQAA